MKEKPRTFLTCFSVLLIAGIVTPLSAQDEQKQPAQSAELQKLIRDVEQNEKYYDDLKLNLTSTKLEKGSFYSLNWPNPIGYETQISLDVQGLKFRQDNQSNGRYFVITQGGLGWLKKTTKPSEPNYTEVGTKTRITVCNGKSIRSFWSEDVVAEKKDEQRKKSSNGLISDKLQHLPNLARPHMFLLENGGPKVPLSTYLKGVKAIRSVPGRTHLREGTVLNLEILGTEEFQKLQCLRIRLEFIDHQGTPRSRRELWLARDRNLIPLRTLSYTYSDSKELPIAEGVVNELQEVRPGVWFPLKAQYNRFYSVTVKRENRQELAWQVKYNVTDVELKPQFPPERFTTLDFPPSTKVTLDKDGKLTKLTKGVKSP